ncbi:hypothetical protein CFC21_069521 [Triticum aestivum]|uniref:Uncharacterized protein n=2 Tax=Triticum aestivum TaxID=4565 RepID=A0A3B6LDC5_WHEAT|nr:glycosyltransferase BC10-like [Triticum aestivum]XP_044386459.1 glycosyltransferase BC10-like [Triticum aestivum]XP_044386460.1 glycosyltransferase BC10-like [Triticum aestivum]KAF7062982.1 hypothetical protein CFC21_069521 [Triticum aestivum]
MPGGGGGAAAVVVVGEGKDGHAAPARAAPRSFPPKLLRPALLSAVLATAFLAAALLIFFGGASSYYRLPRLAVPDALLPAPPACDHQKQGGAPGRWWARPPARSAWHNMSDEELLWAASFEPRAQPHRRGRTPRKVAFLFLTRGPLPLAPLWERFFNGTGTGGAKGGRELFSVYVHTTPGYRLDVPPSSPFHRRQVPSKPTRWGNVNVVDAERRLLANALLDLSNERFVLVSESCIPLYPLPVVHAYLTRSRHSFVGAFDDPSPHGRGRYRVGLAPDVTLSQWRKGAQWFEMDRRLAVFVIADERYYPRFRTECRAPCYVDEHYLPTVLSIEAPERIANRSITLVDWSRGGAHPATFGAADVTEDFLGTLVGKKGNAERCMYNGQPVEVCFLFARKFAPAALPQLLSLSSKILGY